MTSGSTSGSSTPRWACWRSPTRPTTRDMVDHIGDFGASADAFAKALFFGGVLHRFPTLRFAFLECGAGWAAQLRGDLVDRWQKRGPAAIGRLDPSRLDIDEWNRL